MDSSVSGKDEIWFLRVCHHVPHELYTTWVCVALGIQHAMCMGHLVICGLPRSTIIYNFSHKRHDFRKKKVTEHKMRVLIFSTTFVWNISHSKKKWERYDKTMYNGLHVKYPSFLSDCNETWIFSTDFGKVLIYFHENPSSGCRVVPYGRTDITKLIVTFRNFANTPKNTIQLLQWGELPY